MKYTKKRNKNTMSFEEKYAHEFNYIQKKYPDLSKDIQTDYVKQIVSYRQTRLKTPIGRLPVGWNTTVFKPYILEEYEQDEFFENPMGAEMHDSVVSCPKCGSNKTFNIEKQTRSLDEASTVITICYTCKHKSKYS